MPTKRYRLKLDHPYADKGTIVKVSETFSDTDIMAHSDTDMFSIPKSKFDTWLEELKEEVTFTREQADAIHSVVLNEGRYTYATLGDFLRWVDQHTSTEE